LTFGKLNGTVGNSSYRGPGLVGRHFAQTKHGHAEGEKRAEGVVCFSVLAGSYWLYIGLSRDALSSGLFFTLFCLLATSTLVLVLSKNLDFTSIHTSHLDEAYTSCPRRQYPIHQIYSSNQPHNEVRCRCPGSRRLCLRTSLPRRFANMLSKSDIRFVPLICARIMRKKATVFHGETWIAKIREGKAIPG
jgi:hypothetical protein